MDKLLGLTNKIESDKYIKQIEELKVSGAKAREQLKKLAKENAGYLKEFHDLQKKNEEIQEKADVLKGKFE